MTVNEYYQSLFGSKTYKLSLDAGCTCPTRDGTLGTRGCIFCSAAGSGDFVAHGISIPQQIETAKNLLAPKLKSKKIKYIAYFQSFTNTYGDFHRIKLQWEQALSCPDVVGIAIGTRPDCLSEQCLEYLGQLADKTYVQVELGLQTSSEKTGNYIRRGFTTQVYRQAVAQLHTANSKIHVVTHLIFGLPEENQQIMMESVREVVAAESNGIKITCLYVLKGTDLAEDFYKGKFKAIEEEEYYNLLKEALKIIPDSMIIHRLTGDPPKAQLIAPEWTTNKKMVINRINKLLQAV